MNQGKIAEMEAIVAADYSNMAGMVIMKDGKAVYEKYFCGCTEADRIHVFSVTKSILSILIGIALDKGYIHSVDQKVLEFYPEYTVKKGEKTIQNVTIKDMLTMTAPYKYKFNLYLRKVFAYGIFVFCVYAVPERIETDSPVKSTRIHVNESEFL